MRALANAASVPACPPPTTITSNFSGKYILFVAPYSGRNDTRLQAENEMAFDARKMFHVKHEPVRHLRSSILDRRKSNASDIPMFHVKHRLADYFPMQKLEKICPSKSSAEISPVMLEREFCATLSSSANSSISLPLSAA